MVNLGFLGAGTYTATVISDGNSKYDLQRKHRIRQRECAAARFAPRPRRFRRATIPE